MLTVLCILYCLPLGLLLASGLPLHLMVLFGGLYVLLAPVLISTMMEIFD